MKRSSLWIGAWLVCVISLSCAAATPTTATQPVTVAQAYPDLPSLSLAYARLGSLPDNVLLRAEGVEIKTQDVEKMADLVPAGAVRDEVKKNLFFVLENVAVEKVLLASARRSSPTTQPGTDTRPAQEVIGELFQSVVGNVKVSDAEMKAFYDENRNLFGTTSFAQAKRIIERHLTEQKKQKAVKEYVATLGKRMDIVVSETWVKQQATLARDNPIDKARASGKPTLVEFGSDECPVCVQMKPLVEKTIKKYQGKANVLKINANEHPVLSARHGVETLPVFIFFNNQGKETSRHVGSFTEAQFDTKFKELGVK